MLPALQEAEKSSEISDRISRSSKRSGLVRVCERGPEGVEERAVDAEDQVSRLRQALPVHVEGRIGKLGSEKELRQSHPDHRGAETTL